LCQAVVAIAGYVQRSHGASAARETANGLRTGRADRDGLDLAVVLDQLPDKTLAVVHRHRRLPARRERIGKGLDRGRPALWHFLWYRKPLYGRFLRFARVGH
jgi:hypothetical protein